MNWDIGEALGVTWCLYMGITGLAALNRQRRRRKAWWRS